MWLDFKAVPIEATGKLPSDAVAERMYRVHPEYGNWRGQLDNAQHSAESAEAIYEAFRLKAQLLKTQAQLLRDEAGGAYYVSENPRRAVPRQSANGEI